jgi:dinuclear metal center YbgI/SA1388 family protein
MTTVNDVITQLERLAPLALAETWDNVGLLVGWRERPVRRLMTCLTATEPTVREAIEGQADLLVPHHPIPFRPANRVSDDTTVGRLLLQLIEAKIAVYTCHTAWDNARFGINDQIASLLCLQRVAPLQSVSNPTSIPEGHRSAGTGRVGRLDPPLPLAQLVARVRGVLPETKATVTSAGSRNCQRVGIVCGSGGSLIPLASQMSCDTLLTGEATYHQCLEARALGMHIIMIGHHASERFAMQTMADQLQNLFPSLQVWTSKNESDPIAHAVEANVESAPG